MNVPATGTELTAYYHKLASAVKLEANKCLIVRLETGL